MGTQDDDPPTLSPQTHSADLASPSAPVLSVPQTPQGEGGSEAPRPVQTSVASSWEVHHKTWRRFTSIIGSARRPDEQPPFSDD